jgi:hypothetical protein
MTISARWLTLLLLSWIPASASLVNSQSTLQDRPSYGALEIGDPYFPGLGNVDYDVEHYALELAIDINSNEVAATARIRARALLY